MRTPEMQVPPELEELANQVGSFMEYWGFKSVHGRIWTHVFLSQEPLDANDIICRLQISKGLASIAINELLHYEVLQRSGKGPNSTVVYTANPNVLKIILGILRRRERKILAHVSAAAKMTECLNQSDRSRMKISDDRLRALTAMIHLAEKSLDTLLTMQDISLAPWKLLFGKE